MAKITLSVIKADVGSIGGHTKPSEKMLAEARRRIDVACRGHWDGEWGEKALLKDGMVTYTGDDIAFIMSHEYKTGADKIHKFAWDCFMAATEIAREQGCYAAGQDLLKDAPSGNLRGAGPGVAEIEFELLPKHRLAEAFLVFAADKCGPGAFNKPLYEIFCNGILNTGLLLSPKLRAGFTFEIIDMDHQSNDSDRIIRINTADPNSPHLDILALLSDIDRYAVESVYSNAYPDEKIVSVAATRLHNIAGKYTGKDDPVMIFRTQGIFPAPEECLDAFVESIVVTGDCRGSHNRPLLPVAINTPVNGAKCHPLVSCLGFSMNAEGAFANEFVDMFQGPAWDQSRAESLRDAKIFRRQGPFSVGFASRKELAYTGLVETEKRLDERFTVRKN